MATIAKSGAPSLSSRTPCPPHRPTGLVAGEDIAAGDFVYVKNDGKLWRANGTAATAPALYVGIVLTAVKAGRACTPMWGVFVNYGSGLTPGARYYISATAGAIDDAATTGGTVPCAYAWDATQIFVLPPTR